MIRYGTRKFFRDANLTYKELTRNKQDWIFPWISGGSVIYGGGGAWCALYDHAARVVTKLAKRFKIIVLPSTYEFSYAIPNTIFFCRDLYESMHAMPGADFCHDMAFYIGNEFHHKDGGLGKGYFFRDGVESARRIRIPSGNHDISLEGTHLSDVEPFFAEINRFAVIYTDRLHVAIAACLMEKEVHLYPSSYFKNRAVYLSSMRDHFEKVSFHEDFSFGSS